MKKLTRLLIMAVICLLPLYGNASTITLTQNVYSYSNGGEFTATPSSDLSYLLNNYDSKAKIGGGFETFCLEYDEHFVPGSTYNAAISDRAQNGGVNTNSGDPISIGTAYLYSQFAKGVLAGYDYNTTTALRKADAGLLQYAFWYLEGEISLTNVQIADNPFLKLLGDLDKAKLDAKGAYGVSALNLTSTPTRSDDGLRQDQLVYNPVPEPASLILFGLGLLGLGAIKRKFQK